MSIMIDNQEREKVEEDIVDEFLLLMTVGIF